MELNDITIIPVVEERAVVRKQTRTHDAVRARTVVHTDEEVVDATVTIEEIEVEQVALDRWVEAPVPIGSVGRNGRFSPLSREVFADDALRARTVTKPPA